MVYFREKYLLAFSIILILLSSLGASAQGNVTILVSDSATGTSLADAVVRIAPLSKTSRSKGAVDLTDRAGTYGFQYTEPVILHISYLGYWPVSDTIYAPSSHKYQLNKTTANINDVVVTGQYGATSAKESIYQIKVYNSSDFRDKGATNLREALEGAVDVDVSEDPVFGSGIFLNCV